ncbi:hypothetical protein BCR44DRAFT_35077 [Catenaria anguillulae PL171]|uniref:Uncharacterized protein n=1 Tax=Catenaria anguillulae PL171 TaxID=765915 RepID=A0A1Y2HEE3_9FUNG|nr:hypothetical protein BCR44DRAFT_35077 [Catenaria anguillulae PL171]
MAAQPPPPAAPAPAPGPAPAPAPAPGGGAGGAAGPAAPSPSPVIVDPPAPGATLPACTAWRPPPAGPTDAGRWVLGCVRAAAGFQCGPNAAFSQLPQCEIRNWNPACAQQPWLLPQTGTVVNRVPIYGCISEAAIPTGYLCPGTSDVMPSGTTDPTMLVSGNVTTACTVAASPTTSSSSSATSSSHTDAPGSMTATNAKPTSASTKASSAGSDLSANKLGAWIVAGVWYLALFVVAAPMYGNAGGGN